MTPRDKAKELFDKYEKITGLNGRNKWMVKAICLSCVGEINNEIYKNTPKDDLYANIFAHDFWNEVLEEINKI
jgi:hypothetical protein